MQSEELGALRRLNERPENIRNFCMLAHVDHGKTTLSDYLVASNGILSPQLAGEVRLLDSRPDEQERRITMKASSITLSHLHRGLRHVLNLVDSPGHIDFSCEVSAAMRLCDGAVIIVDVLDGVTQQTAAILRHSYDEGLSMCLVLNKIDLLLTAQQCTVEEAYTGMRSIIETCNATLAAHANQMKIQGLEWDMEREDPGDDVWFDPVKGNVLFCSGHDGWCFGVSTFARLYEGKLPTQNLREVLWGEHYLDAKNKTIRTTPTKDGQQPLAVQLMLEPIWQLYNAFLVSGDEERQRKMSSKLNMNESVWNHPRSNAHTKLKALLSHWIPLAMGVLDAVCEQVDSPVKAQRKRIPALIRDLEKTPNHVKDALLSCDPSPDGPCIVYICKLIDTSHLVGRVIGSVENKDDAFIGFARVYCGRLRAGDEVFVHSDKQVVVSRVSKVFLFRGIGLEEASEVGAGLLCGVGGLTPLITKCATISTVSDVMPFKPLILPSTSIVRLSVFPKDPKKLEELENGMRLLYKVDPQVEISILPTGEHVLGTAGTVHAERCLRDLVDTFARVEVTASEPLVSFRESILSNLNAKPRLHTGTAASGAFAVTLYARALPPELLPLLADDERNRFHANDDSGGPNDATRRNAMGAAVSAALRGHRRFARAMGAGGLLAYGPRRLGFVGAVLLADFDSGEAAKGEKENEKENEKEKEKEKEKAWATFAALRESIVAGFQAAAEAGPMAQEPVFGVAFVLTNLVAEGAEGLSGGVVLPCVREACRAAMEVHPCRLVEPVYECTVYASGATQGKIYASLSRRRSDIIEEVHNEGSDLFYISCWLPAVEAFGLQDELRVLTQGASTAHLRMDHWAYIEDDPFFVPTTKEELEEHGAEMAEKNVAAKLLERIKRRKGLFRERTVESAEKQKFSLKAA